MLKNLLVPSFIGWIDIKIKIRYYHSKKLKANNLNDGNYLFSNNKKRTIII